MLRRDHYTKRRSETSLLEGLHVSVGEATAVYAQNFGLEADKVIPLKAI